MTVCTWMETEGQIQYYNYFNGIFLFAFELYTLFRSNLSGSGAPNRSMD